MAAVAMEKAESSWMRAVERRTERKLEEMLNEAKANGDPLNQSEKRSAVNVLLSQGLTHQGLWLHSG